MKIEFLKLRISNFMSIGEANIDLSNAGFTLVSGKNKNPEDGAKSNGSGKSSIFEAIFWCLTGNTIRGNKDVVNCHGNDGAVVNLQFKYNGIFWELERSKNHSKLKTNLRVVKDGIDISGKGIRDSEKILESHLPGLTSQLIGNVIILGQGLPQKFTNNTPSGRKELLEKLTKSDFMIEDLKQKIQKRQHYISSQISLYKDLKTRSEIEVRSSSEVISFSEGKIEDLENKNSTAEQRLQQAISDIDRLQSLHDNKRKELDFIAEDLLRKQQERNEISEKILSCSTQISTEFDSILRDNNEDLSNKKSELGIKEAEYKRLSSISDTCPTCGQKLQGVTKPDISEIYECVVNLKNIVDQLTSRSIQIQNEKNLKIQDQTKAFTIERNNVDQKIRDLQVKSDRLKSEINSLQIELDKSIKHRVSIQQEKATFDGFVSSYRKQISDSEENIKINKALIQKYSEDLSFWERHQEIINKFNTIVTRDFRGYLLSNIIEFIQQTAKLYCKYIFGTDLIEFKLDGNSISINYSAREYESLSGGERQKVDLIIQFSIREMLCKSTGFTTNLLVLDEIFDNLDDVGCSKIIDFISSRLVDISSIFVITHHNSYLNIPCDNEIVVVKDERGVSTIR